MPPTPKAALFHAKSFRDFFKIVYPDIENLTLDFGNIDIGHFALESKSFLRKTLLKPNVPNI